MPYLIQCVLSPALSAIVSKPPSQSLHHKLQARRCFPAPTLSAPNARSPSCRAGCVCFVTRFPLKASMSTCGVTFPTSSPPGPHSGFPNRNLNSLRPLRRCKLSRKGTGTLWPQHTFCPMRLGTLPTLDFVLLVKWYNKWVMQTGKTLAYCFDNMV